eukprot:c17322_g1_i2.p2 GENE.c17322_g1_i2~~c17322_g1_i2.p2  ORF type:complete len:127 (-),score=25.93 c17322_g1_i2:25-405(-)
MGLTLGTDFGAYVDTAQLFQTFRRGKSETYSLAQQVLVAFNHDLFAARLNSHDPSIDAKWSILLYTQVTGPRLETVKRTLQSMRQNHSLPSSPASVVEGICSQKFNRNKCFCGQPTVNSDNFNLLG